MIQAFGIKNQVSPFPVKAHPTISGNVFFVCFLALRNIFFGFFKAAIWFSVRTLCMFYQVTIKASADADLIFVFGCPEGEKFLYPPNELGRLWDFCSFGRPKSHPSVFL